MSIYRAYLTASGRLQSYVLTHDVKKALQSFSGKTGVVQLLSVQSTTALLVAENDPSILAPFLQYAFSQFQAQIQPQTARRSGLSGPAYHQMAALSGLTLSLPFENGKLLTSPHQDVMTLDYEPKPGRREFIITVVTIPSEGKT